MKVDVALPNTKLDFLTYEADIALEPGDLVAVPLRDREQRGIVVRTGVTRDVGYLKKVKALVQRGFIAPAVVTFYEWLAEYYHGSMGDALRLAFPGKILGAEPSLPAAGAAVPAGRPPNLTEPQERAVARITRALMKKEFRVFLVYGITASGKTEIYIRCLQEAVRAGGRGLVMVPEISMTPLLLDQFRRRFGAGVAAYHSALTEKERREIWHAVKAGQYQVVVGPRSAIFLPVPDLRIIVVDEEHDPSYKEHQQALKYHARDAAVMRGKVEKLTVVLGSATPQVESYHNASIGKYELISLKERIADRPLPAAELIDLKTESHRFVSRRMEKALAETLDSGGQAIVFLNRRGFAPYVICPNCGYTATCPHCSLPLVYHKGPSPGLFCHVCDHRTGLVTVCPKCRRGTLLYQGAGTQRVEELVRRIAGQAASSVGADPKALVVRLDRDTARKRGAAEDIFNRFASGAARVLLGTQLVTKGLDFPTVTLVGIVNADIIFNLPDFRSAERTFQVLTQVAGRSGRGERKGRVLIQTMHPRQYAIIFSQLQDYLKFYTAEIKVRKELALPPFSRLILLRFRGPDETAVRAEAKRVFEMAAKVRGVRAYGPNPSFYGKVRRDFRYFVLLKTGLDFPRHRLAFLKGLRLQSVAFEVDVDPQEVF